MPLWGERSLEEEINFAWPTPEIYATMQSNVRLSSIEFETYCEGCSSLSSVKVNLSNGQSSPIFKDEDYSHYNKETITFDPNRPFNSIAAYDGPSNTGLIRFMDSSENEVYVYDPNNWSRATVEYKIGDNEEIIGVYGVKDKDIYFSSFGFIVKVKQQ